MDTILNDERCGGRFTISEFQQQHMNVGVMQCPISRHFNAEATSKNKWQPRVENMNKLELERALRRNDVCCEERWRSCVLVAGWLER
jgi:hypothetical protein